MGQLYNELRRTRFSLALKKLLGDTKTEGGLERYGETLTPVINMWDRAESAWPRGEQLWSCRFFQAAVVGEFGFFGVGLPVASRDLLIVENAKNLGTVNCTLNIATRAVIAATGVVGNIAVARDQRAQTDATQVIKFLGNVETWTGSDPGAFGQTVEEATLNSEFITMPYVVKPGGALFVQEIVANTAVTVILSGYVRPAQPGELLGI